MNELTLSQLQSMILSGCAKAITHKDQTNAINIFPVPDKDTGSNIASTLTAVHQTLEKNNYQTLPELVEETMQAVLVAAAGNSGIMMASWLQGFLQALDNKDTYTAEDMHVAFTQGHLKATQSVETPLPGTILDVMSAGATFPIESSVTEGFEHTMIRVQQALSDTEHHMQLLESHHVIDAGALGWSYFFAGMTEYVLSSPVELYTPDMQVVGDVPLTESANVYEVIAILSEVTSTREELKQTLESLGDSLDILITDTGCKMHIHTNQPDLVNELLQTLGTVSHTQTTDMRTQVHTSL